jgi:hypothetical protein
VHHVRLLETRTSKELSTFGLGDFPFYLCPASGDAVNDSTDQQPDTQAENQSDAD